MKKIERSVISQIKIRPAKACRHLFREGRWKPQAPGLVSDPASSAELPPRSPLFSKDTMEETSAMGRSEQMVTNYSPWRPDSRCLPASLPALGSTSEQPSSPFSLKGKIPLGVAGNGEGEEGLLLFQGFLFLLFSEGIKLFAA